MDGWVMGCVLEASDLCKVVQCFVLEPSPERTVQLAKLLKVNLKFLSAK